MEIKNILWSGFAAVIVTVIVMIAGYDKSTGVILGIIAYCYVDLRATLEMLKDEMVVE